MKLSVWAKSQGIAYLTAYRMWRSGRLPVPAYQMETGTIIVDLAGTGPEALLPKPTGNECVLYARVSGHDHKGDLDRQIERLRATAAQRGFVVVKEVSEVGSGMNGQRKQLLALLKDPAVTTIVVEHRDRLMRFGADYVEATLAAAGRQLIVVDQTELRSDLVQDMIDVLTSFCARRYGRRSASRRAAAALAAAEQARA